MTDLQRVLDAIDAVTADVCAWCQATLPVDGPSAWFCCEAHQRLWLRSRAEPVPVPAVSVDPIPLVALGRLGVPVAVTADGVEFGGRGFRLDHVYVDEVPMYTLRARLQEVALSMAPFIAHMGRVFEDLAVALRPLVEHMERLRGATRPTEPRALALWLRQNRNTGPTPRRRAPKQLGPRTATARRTR